MPTDVLDNIPQRITKTSLDEIPTKDEIARATAGLKNGKAPIQQTGPTNHQCLEGGICTTVSVSITWKDASILTIYKKGDRTDCGNYRRIPLLSVAGEIFARILLSRLSTHIILEVVPETQCGFRGNRSIDQCTWYVSTSVRRSIQLGGPEKCTTMIEALPAGIMANVSVGVEVSESFNVTNGVKQGCVLGPALLHLHISNAQRSFHSPGSALINPRWALVRS